MKMSGALLTVLFALTLAGCAGFTPRPQPLDVGLAGLSLIDVGLIEQRFAVDLRVRNPNRFDIPVQGLRYTLELGGQSFARGHSAGPARIPGYGEAVVRTEAVSHLSHILQHLRTLQQEGGLSYRLHGQADLGGLHGVQPFSVDGEIALPDFLRQ